MNSPPRIERVGDTYILSYTITEPKTGQRLASTFLKSENLEGIILKLAQSHSEAVLLNERLKRKYQK